VACGQLRTRSSSLCGAAMTAFCRRWRPAERSESTDRRVPPAWPPPPPPALRLLWEPWWCAAEPRAPAPLDAMLLPSPSSSSPSSSVRSSLQMLFLWIWAQVWCWGLILGLGLI